MKSTPVFHLFRYVVLCSLCFAFAAAVTKTRNVLRVTLDGLRWQEVFRGAEEALKAAFLTAAVLPAIAKP